MSLPNAQALGACHAGARLITPPAVLTELRLAMLADIRSVGVELLAIIGEVESLAAGDELDVTETRRHCRDMTAAVKTRQELHEVVGLPGQSLAERTVTGHAHCALALDILERHHETLAARLRRHDLAHSDESGVSERVGSLGVFLRETRVVLARQVIPVEGARAPGQGEPCQR